jgi:hypothetical protein
VVYSVWLIAKDNRQPRLGLGLGRFGGFGKCNTAATVFTCCKCIKGGVAATDQKQLVKWHTAQAVSGFEIKLEMSNGIIKMFSIDNFFSPDKYSQCQ